MATWEIEFYIAPNGTCPAQEFLDGLSKSDELTFVDRKFCFCGISETSFVGPMQIFFQIIYMNCGSRLGEARFGCSIFSFIKKKLS